MRAKPGSLVAWVPKEASHGPEEGPEIGASPPPWPALGVYHSIFYMYISLFNSYPPPRLGATAFVSFARMGYLLPHLPPLPTLPTSLPLYKGPEILRPRKPHPPPYLSTSL